MPVNTRHRAYGQGEEGGAEVVGHAAVSLAAVEANDYLGHRVFGVGEIEARFAGEDVWYGQKLIGFQTGLQFGLARDAALRLTPRRAAPRPPSSLSADR